MEFQWFFIALSVLNDNHSTFERHQVTKSTDIHSRNSLVTFLESNARELYLVALMNAIFYRGPSPLLKAGKLGNPVGPQCSYISHPKI